MNKKIILIIVLLVIIVIGGWYFIYRKPAIAPGPQPSEQEQACIDSGGTVTTANCCESASDFPNSCLIGACGCASEYSHEIKTCDCGDGCWDGTKCVEPGTDTSDWETYTNPRYGYTMKYPQDWTAKHEYGPNEILGHGYYEANSFTSPIGYTLLFAVVPKGSDIAPVPRTGVGAGDFVDSDETVNINGTEVGIKYLVFEGKVKEIFFNDFEIEGLWGRAYLSYFGEEDYRNFDMTGAEEIKIVKAILESYELQSPAENLNSFCGTSTNGQCSADADCMTGGCSGQVCQSKSEEPVITTCEYTECYNAQTYGKTCGCVDKKCQWK
jgi:eight-cysteine-cluster-containing protein